MNDDMEEFFRAILRNAVMSNVMLAMDGNDDDLEHLYRAHEALVECVEHVQEMIDAAEVDMDERFKCIDCNVNTIDEYYMVYNELWLSVVEDSNAGLLCIGCLEKRLGRTLTKEDFTEAPVNTGENWGRSERLQSRLVA